MILITGGEKSGKSSFALQLAMKMGERRAFLATAEPFDEEMKVRIERHKEKRSTSFDTFEEPIYIPNVLNELSNYDVLVIDCMTTWLGNLMHYNINIENMVKKLIDSLNGNEIIVSNEVGMGIIPANATTRKYVEELGKLNSTLAFQANEVYFMVSGIGVKIK
ncbi:MAG: bifunctional adenosylcobinamide kinase/adenosylcobinamide-phosphate guanylyltransferase [Thermotoga sp.]|nr:MAG: bifunctional adenosylcobinamide kinase/adenosylcobinamide-phosphate guanylyltransferase [Thermotoga sp.]